ncbi:MAG: hypothetical protein AB8B91_13455 [Rubripirellula sp.]
MQIALLPQVGDEQPLVRAHLEHFLRDAANTTAFDPFLQPEYLRQVFAETKLMAGIGDDEQWYKLLTAAQRQAIRAAVELRLSTENVKRSNLDEPASLKVQLKGVKDLVVRIYEINTLSYYRTHDKAVDTDIDLDGLIATHERKIEFHQPAVQRHQEDLELPEIQGRGVWIVDLIGKGVRARALIRRGFVDHIRSSNANGMVFTIIDENRVPIPAATMLVGSREFIADDEGRISLPPLSSKTSRSAVISDGSIASKIKFQHLRERYELHAGMHLDRTSLQSGAEVELLIRPRLSMSGTIVAPKTLRHVAVRIEATDLDGLSITHQINDLELDQNGELMVPIRVPARLAKLSVTLSGTVDRLADGTQQTLETNRSWDVAGIRRTSSTHDSFLTRDEDEYVIEVRGRNGELIPRATVVIGLTTELRNALVEATLQSDDKGQVRLGTLSGVQAIRFSVPSGIQHQRDLNLNRVHWPDEIHTIVGRDILLPLAETIGSRFRLLEIRGNSYHTDQTDKMRVLDGLLHLQGLPAGDFHLIDLANAKRTNIAVVAGEVVGTVATGSTRHREVSPAVPLGIASITRDVDGMTIQLSGETTSARVHLYASRYLDGAVPMSQLDLSLPRLGGRGTSIKANGYISDLRLGDEYQYVLRRRYADKYPGVMLPQPSVILNPWETEETSNTSQAVSAGDAPHPSADAMLGEALSREMRDEEAESQAIGSDYDFLADPGVVVANLRPDENGVVTIPADVLQGMPILQLVACDAVTIMQRTVTAPLVEIEPVDLRLANALNAEIPYSFEREVMVASPEQPLDLKSLGSAQLQVYSSVADLLKLYKTLVNDPRMNDFDELAAWHQLDREAKASAYSRLASHELHLFLWFHDPTFFREVVAPYLQNKKEKQFVDHWLLGGDLSPFTKLWRYNQLNAAERALLAMRLPEARKAIQRELHEVVENHDESYADVRLGIESALRTSGMANANGAFDRVELQVEADASGIVQFGFEPPAESRGRMARKEKASAARKLSELSLKKTDLFFGGRDFSDSSVDAFYRDIDSTKQWAESHWDRVRTVGGPSPSTLINVNSFWEDLSRANTGSLTVSTNLLRPVENRHSALIALALSGLPLTAGDVGLPKDNGEVYKPSHAVAVVTKRLKKLGEQPGQDGTILVGQRFAALEDVNRTKQRTESAEPTEFLTGVAYVGQIVVSNPTSAQRVVDVFWQLPAGSLPLSGSQTTDSQTLVLEPFAVQSVKYEFYFPKQGAFAHYPATVAVEDSLITQAAAREFKVVDVPTEQTAITWEKVAESGTPEQIHAFLATANLRDLNWMLIAHRMRDQAVYQSIMETLQESSLPVKDLWAYSLVHRDEQAMQGYLSLRDDLVGRVGPKLESPLLGVEPIERRTQEMLEYAPLVRARIHRLGDQDEILNDAFLAQYQSFVRSLAYSEQIAADEKLALAYYLLIQNRISESIETFTAIDRQKIDSELQYDYLDAYLAMHRAQYDHAEQVSRKHADHPVPRWHSRFNELLSQLGQRRNLWDVEKQVSIGGDEEKKPVSEVAGDLAVIDRERRQSNASDQQPEVIVRIEGDSLRIDHRKAQEVVLNFYGVDLELLFSKAPFVREDLQRMAMVRPASSEHLKFDSMTGVGRYELNHHLRRQTLLVEVVAGASRSTALYYGGDITTYVSDSFGQLQATDTSTHRPVSAAYVKVYAKYPDGQVRFYKDGYTDSRGRFDYTSVSAGDAKGADRYAILVMSDEKGATLHDVAAPQQ